MRRTRFKFPVSTLVGSNLENIFSLIKGHRIEPKYRFKFIITLIVAGIFEILNLTERIVWKKRIRDHRLTTPPIFIIGFWRSGTTLLHNLLCQDPKAAYTTTFQTVFPNLVLTQSGWLKPLINYFLPADRPFDNVSMDVDFPQEEEFGMMNIQPHTIYKFFIYPVDFDRIIEQDLFTAQLPPENVSRWKKRYAIMVAKATFNTGGSRYMGKNPCNLTRISLLKEMYPDAKFIFIHRNPYHVIESLYRFILSIFPGTQLQDVPADFSREKIVRLYEKIMRSYFEERKILSSSDLIEIRMDDFLRDKIGHLKNIYETFGLDNYKEALPEFENYLASNPYVRNESYKPEPETINLVDKYASHILKELDYEEYKPAPKIPL
jgi:hypothetical protein